MLSWGGKTHAHLREDGDEEDDEARGERAIDLVNGVEVMIVSLHRAHELPVSALITHLEAAGIGSVGD